MNERLKHLVFLITEPGYFCSHRLPLALAAKRAGFRVTVVTNCHQCPAPGFFEEALKEIEFYHVPFHRSRLNPLKEVKTLWQIWKAYRVLRPNIVHQVALKPVLYGTFCARLLGISRIVNALGGMGYLFTHRSLKSVIIKPFMAFAFRVLLRHRRCVLILQNPDDVGLMAPLVGIRKIRLIRGAGINLDAFHPDGEPPSPPIKALMVSRLLWSKGLGELVEAAGLLRKEGVPLEIQVAGDPDPQNPASVPLETLATWKKETCITWLGNRTDIAALYNQVHIAVLPSYREGLPKSLLEAAACGKPIVTTNVPGCREVVVDGKNGLLVPPKDAVALARALKMLAGSPDLRVRMGKSSRQKAEQEFDENKIIAETMAIYQG